MAMTCMVVKIDKAANLQDYRIDLLCSFNTSPGTAVAAIPQTVMDLINDGRYVYAFSTIPGDTGPTDSSDLQILDADGRTIVAAAGNGANVIKNAAVSSVFYGDGPTPGSTNHYPKGDGKGWTITVTNNAVNNSSFHLIMQLGR